MGLAVKKDQKKNIARGNDTSYYLSCNKLRRAGMSQRINLQGQRFGAWSVIAFGGANQKGQTLWLCRCDCGTERAVVAQSLRNCTSTSCGCLRGDKIAESKTKHGHAAIFARTDKQAASRSATSEGWGAGRKALVKLSSTQETLTYQRWISMKARVRSKHPDTYRHYGAKGIQVCDRWLNSFENFLEDMGECPTGLTLDRIDSDGHYEPGNCRWADYKTQANNRKYRADSLVQCETCGCMKLPKAAPSDTALDFWT